METFNFCDTMANELGSWKTKFNDTLRKMDSAPCEDKANITPHLNQIRMIVQELSDRIEAFRTQCGDSAVNQTFGSDTKFGNTGEKWEVMSMLSPERRLHGTNL
jgi:cysteinyl-tRNA synthetase